MYLKLVMFVSAYFGGQWLSTACQIVCLADHALVILFATTKNIITVYGGAYIFELMYSVVWKKYVGETPSWYTFSGSALINRAIVLEVESCFSFGVFT